MKNIKLFDRRLGFSLGAASILFGALAPAIVPAFASADVQLTSRSVQMDNSNGDATGVNYQVNFNATNAATVDMAIEFCSNSPLIASGSACTAPAGMVVGSGAGGAVLTGLTPHVLRNNGDTAFLAGNNFVDFVATVASGANQITIGSVHNPTAINTTFYARIMIFSGAENSSGATQYNANTSGASFHAGAVDGSTAADPANMSEDGSVALSTGSQIGVSAAVLESLTFCVFGDPGYVNADPGASTGNSSSYLSGLANGNNGPTGGATPCTANSGVTSNAVTTNMVLGQHIASGVTALQTSTVSYQAGWTQLSTNAQSGATVYMKTGNSCIGLHRNGDIAGTCAIPAMGAGTGAGTPTAGTAGFGVHFGGGGTNGAFAAPSGTQSGSIVIGTNYTGSNYSMNSDVTGAYGGSVYTTNSLPAADQNVPFGIAGAIANNTPSGQYSANLNLIAVGTF